MIYFNVFLTSQKEQRPEVDTVLNPSLEKPKIRAIPGAQGSPPSRGLVEGRLSYATFLLFFAERLFPQLELMTFRSQRSKLIVTTKTHLSSLEKPIHLNYSIFTML